MQPKGKLDPYRYSIACKIQKLLGTIDEIIADALHNLASGQFKDLSMDN